MSTPPAEAAPPAPSNGWGSPLLPHVALVALALFCIGQALEIFAPKHPAALREQMVYVMNPATNGSLQELKTFLDQGWRVTHLSAGAAASSAPVNGGSIDKWYAHSVLILER